jgi:hypothetical protein
VSGLRRCWCGAEYSKCLSCSSDRELCDSSKCLGLGDVDVSQNILSLWAIVLLGIVCKSSKCLGT